MKNIKQIRENFDLITEKEEKEGQKLTALVRAGLYDVKKLPALKKALDKSADKMTGQEKRMLLNLLDSLISQVTSDEQVYRKVKQNVHTMNEAKMDTYSKFDPRFKEGYPSDKDIPTVIILKRKAIRVYPDNQKVALYYSQALDKYVTIPFNDIQTGINEAVQPQGNSGKKKRRAAGINATEYLKNKNNKTRERASDALNLLKGKGKYSSATRRFLDVKKEVGTIGGAAGVMINDKFKKAAIQRALQKRKAMKQSRKPTTTSTQTLPKPVAAPTPVPASAPTQASSPAPVVKTKRAVKPKATAKTKPVVKTKPKTTATKPKATSKTKAKLVAAAKAKAKAKTPVKPKPQVAKPKKSTQSMPRTKRSTATMSLQGLSESFSQKLQMIREDVAEYMDQEYFRRGIQPPPLGASGGGGRGGRGSANSRAISTKRYTGTGERSSVLNRRVSSFRRQNTLTQSPVDKTRQMKSDVLKAVRLKMNQQKTKSNIKSDIERENRYKAKQPDAKAAPKAKPVQAKDANLKSATGSSVSGQSTSSAPSSTKVTPPNAGYKSVSVPKKPVSAVTPPNAGYKSVSVPKKTEVVPGTAPQAVPPAAAPASKPVQRSVTEPASAPNAGQAPRSLENAAEKTAQKQDQQRADREANQREKTKLRNQQQTSQKNKASALSRGGMLAALGAAGAAAAAAGAAVDHKGKLKVDVKNAWDLQKKDLPDTLQRRLMQANRRALETTNESVLSTIKDMVDNSITEQTVTINEQEININNTVAKKIMLVYESVNKTNQKKMEKMLNESATSFNKVLTFALRQ